MSSGRLLTQDCLFSNSQQLRHSRACSTLAPHCRLGRRRHTGRLQQGDGSGRHVCCRADTAEADAAPSARTADSPTSIAPPASPPSTSVPRSDDWELDFSSRPILDSRGKKRWELLICSPDRSWVYSRWFPNNRINSTQVPSGKCLGSGASLCGSRVAVPAHQVAVSATHA